MFTVCTWITLPASWGKMKGRLQTPRQNGDQESRETGLAYLASGCIFGFSYLAIYFFQGEENVKDSEDLQAFVVSLSLQKLNRNGRKE